MIPRVGSYIRFTDQAPAGLFRGIFKLTIGKAYKIMYHNPVGVEIGWFDDLGNPVAHTENFLFASPEGAYATLITRDELTEIEKALYE